MRVHLRIVKKKRVNTRSLGVQDKANIITRCRLWHTGSIGVRAVDRTSWHLILISNNQKWKFVQSGHIGHPMTMIVGAPAPSALLWACNNVAHFLLTAGAEKILERIAIPKFQCLSADIIVLIVCETCNTCTSATARGWEGSREVQRVT